jgi:hypothetical protein
MQLLRTAWLILAVLLPLPLASGSSLVLCTTPDGHAEIELGFFGSCHGHEHSHEHSDSGHDHAEHDSTAGHGDESDCCGGCQDFELAIDGNIRSSSDLFIKLPPAPCPAADTAICVISFSAPRQWMPIADCYGSACHSPSLACIQTVRLLI